MYSDSRLVIDALAELIEAVVERHQAPIVSDERMTQVRYIMQVDEVSFRSNITKEHLVTIESKEMVSILEELVSAIGLQRFRFMDRQKGGACADQQLISTRDEVLLLIRSCLFLLSRRR
jgi:hypothetical protein